MKRCGYSRGTFHFHSEPRDPDLSRIPATALRKSIRFLKKERGLKGMGEESTPGAMDHLVYASGARSMQVRLQWPRSSCFLSWCPAFFTSSGSHNDVVQKPPIYELLAKHEHVRSVGVSPNCTLNARVLIHPALSLGRRRSGSRKAWWVGHMRPNHT